MHVVFRETHGLEESAVAAGSRPDRPRISSCCPFPTATSARSPRAGSVRDAAGCRLPSLRLANLRRAAASAVGRHLCRADAGGREGHPDPADRRARLLDATACNRSKTLARRQGHRAGGPRRGRPHRPAAGRRLDDAGLDAAPAGRICATPAARSRRRRRWRSSRSPRALRRPRRRRRARSPTSAAGSRTTA